MMIAFHSLFLAILKDMFNKTGKLRDEKLEEHVYLELKEACKSGHIDQLGFDDEIVKRLEDALEEGVFSDLWERVQPCCEKNLPQPWWHCKLIDFENKVVFCYVHGKQYKLQDDGSFSLVKGKCKLKEEAIPPLHPQCESPFRRLLCSQYNIGPSCVTCKKFDPNL